MCPAADPDHADLLIVGGGPAALACARAYRRAGGAGPVAMVCDEERLPYRRPPLSKELLRGELDPAELPLAGDRWPAEHGVRFLAARAAAIDTERAAVALADGRELGYGQCVLVTGARPTRLPVPGADDPGVLVVRTLDHVRELVARLDAIDGPADVTVVGSGFVGCEVAASLRRRGVAVTLVSDEELPQLARLGEDAGEAIAGWLREDGVRLHLGAAVDAIGRAGSRLEVAAGDRAVDADLIVMATGAQPRAELAAAAGLELAGGAVPVAAGQRTERPGLLAAGDVCRAHHPLAGRPLRVEHWGDALAQGEVAGRTAAGEQDAAWTDVPGFWSTIGERTLKHGAWGDGHDVATVTRGAGGAFAVRYHDAAGRLVGVLAHAWDEAYASGLEEIAAAAG